MIKTAYPNANERLDASNIIEDPTLSSYGNDVRTDWLHRSRGGYTHYFKVAGELPKQGRVTAPMVVNAYSNILTLPYLLKHRTRVIETEFSSMLMPLILFLRDLKVSNA